MLPFLENERFREKRKPKMARVGHGLVTTVFTHYTLFFIDWHLRKHLSEKWSSCFGRARFGLLCKLCRPREKEEKGGPRVGPGTSCTKARIMPLDQQAAAAVRYPIKGPDYFGNDMTKFIVNNRTDPWKTDVNLFTCNDK